MRFSVKVALTPTLQSLLVSTVWKGAVEFVRQYGTSPGDPVPPHSQELSRDP